MQSIPFHDIANIFPLVHGKEFVELKQDIKTNGVIEPIVMYEGQILDGRNRFRACQEVGVAPEFVDYSGSDPVGYVLSLNLHRRHLNESQRAMVAARVANLEVGQRADRQICPSTTQHDAAEKLNVSERSVKTAKKVQREAAPELVEAIERGEVSVSAAAAVSGLPHDEQKKAVEDGAVREVAKATRKSRPPKVSQAKNAKVFFSSVDRIAGLTSSGALLAAELNEEEIEEARINISRALVLITQTQEALDNA